MAGLVNKIKNLWGDNEEDYEYEDDMNEYDEDEEEIEDEYEEEEPVERQPQRDSYQRRNFNNSMNGGNKVVNFSATAKLQVVLFKPGGILVNVRRPEPAQLFLTLKIQTRIWQEELSTSSAVLLMLRADR